MHLPMHVHVGCVGSFGFVVSVLFFLDFLDSPNAMKSGHLPLICCCWWTSMCDNCDKVLKFYENFVVCICCQRIPSDSVNRRWAKGLQSGWIAAAHLEWFPSSTMLWRRAGTGRGALCVASNFCCPCAMYIRLLDLIFRYSQAPSLGEVLRASSLEARSRRWVSCSDCSSTCILQCKCVHLCTESKARRLPKPRVCRVEFLHIIVAMEAPDITQCEGAYPGLQWTWRWRLQWMGWLKCCLTSSGTFSLD